jgi:hypothetical protein
MAAIPAMINDSLRPMTAEEFPWADEKLHLSYGTFYEICREVGFPLRFTSPYDFDWETRQFHGWWERVGEGWEPVREPFRPGFIFDKAFGADEHSSRVIEYFHSEGVPIFDPLEMARFCNDKWRIYQQFEEFSPLSRLLEADEETLAEQIYDFFAEMDRRYVQHDDRAVLKPLHGYQSRGVYVVARGPHGLELHFPFVAGQIHGEDVIQAHLQGILAQPYMIQAWVNTLAGLPRIGLEGLHPDVRFIFAISEPGVARFVQLFVKTIAGMVHLPPEEFEDPPFHLVTPIAEWMAEQFPYGIFSIDVMRDASGAWFLTELNDQVGLTADFDDPQDVQGMIELQRAFVAEMLRLYEP